MAERTPDWKTTRLAAIVGCWAFWLAGSITGMLRAEDPPAAQPPRIALLNPLGVQPGQTTRVVLRGWSLKDHTAVIADSEQVKITILSHAAAPIPAKQKVELIGDEQLELDIEVPAEHPVGSIQILVRTAAGESPVHRLQIGSSVPLVEEMEPNDGFRQAQQVNVPQMIAGNIHADTNVDVFTFELSQPMNLQIRVEAAALGSNLDSLLTLLSTDGTLLASNDDHRSSLNGASAADVIATSSSVDPARRDSLIRVTLQPGRYLLTVQDAHDRGGPAHPYRLALQSTE